MNWESLVDYWFDTKHQHYWFQSTPEDDRQIYQDLISSQKFPFPSPPPGFEPEADTLKANLGKVIYYDQILRHLYRTTGSKPYPKWALDYSIQLALPYLPIPSPSIKINNTKKKRNPLPSNQPYFEKTLTPYQQCFFWMPLRHSNRLDFLWILHDWVQKQRSKFDKDNTAYRRCYYATVKRITSILQDQFRQSLYKKAYSPVSGNDVSLADWNTLLDSESTYNYKILPKVFPLLETSGKSTQFPEVLSVLIKTWQKEYTRYTAPHNPLIISLSGGVDSMITLVIAKLMGHRVSAVMINYHNREEAATEQILVENWCKALRVPLFVREIKEISRSQQDREFYETHTRTIRFTTYTDVQNYQRTTLQSDQNIPIVLGHNYDDTKENALNNIRHHKHYGCLGKMRTFEQYDSVTLFRPFLTIPKHKLVEAACFLQLPYFVDSTPSWSERGRLRDNVIPALEQYDPEFFNRIFEFSYQFQELSNVIDTQVVKKILQSVIYTTTTNTTTVNTDNTTTTTITSRDPLTNPTLNLTGDQFPVYIHHYNCASLYVWKKVFGELGIVCTHKSLNCLIERWKKSKSIKKNFQQILSSTLYISVNNTTLIVYRKSKSVTPVSPTAPQFIPSTISSLPSIKDLPSISSLPPLSALPSLSSIS